MFYENDNFPSCDAMRTLKEKKTVGCQETKVNILYNTEQY